MELIDYKTVGEVRLQLHVFRPAAPASTNRSAIVFFFGGGWVGGSPEQFYPHCRHFAARGMVATSAEYRVHGRHGTTPFECVADGKSAIRWLRTHAPELGIDPGRIVAGGGSAGGHVAACTAGIGGLDEVGEDRRISSRPDALILFNPVVDTTETGYGSARVGPRQQELSPVHQVRPGLPPTIIFHGTADTVVSLENVERFTQRMIAAGNRCELLTFAGKEHAFFNYNRDDNQAYLETVGAADRFLTNLGFLR